MRSAAVLWHINTLLHHCYTLCKRLRERHMHWRVSQGLSMLSDGLLYMAARICPVKCIRSFELQHQLDVLIIIILQHHPPALHPPHCLCQKMPPHTPHPVMCILCLPGWSLKIVRPCLCVNCVPHCCGQPLPRRPTLNVLSTNDSNGDMPANFGRQFFCQPANIYDRYRQ